MSSVGVAGGYEAEAVDGSRRAGLMCLHCEHWLREPVQTEDGLRLCRTCFNCIKSFPGGTCEKCGVSSSETCYPDKAVQREVLSLLVYCSHEAHGCTWQGPLKEWEAHCSQCAFKGIACPHEGCSLQLPQAKLDQHLLECPFRLVSCEHCFMEIAFQEVENHHLECSEFPITCTEEVCAEKFPRKKLLEHNAKECKVVTCLTCSTKILRDTGKELASNFSYGDNSDLPQVSEPSTVRGGPLPSHDAVSAPHVGLGHPDLPPVHLADPLQSFRHHQALAEHVQELERGVASIQETHKSAREESLQFTETMKELKEENNLLRSELKGLANSMSDITALVQTLRTQLPAPDNKPSPALDHAHLEKLESVVRADSQRSVILQALKKEVTELHKELAFLKERLRGTLPLVHQDGLTAATGRDIAKDGAPSTRREATVRSAAHGMLAKGEVGVAFDSRIGAVEKRVEEIAKQVTMVKVHGQDLELQLQASLASTHNGAFLWRIPDVSRRRRDAIDERVTSIYSPPFYTGRNGYKMCIRAYLNGDGMGYKTHLSLFFVLMRGECDPLLKWPFEYKVSMILVGKQERK